MRARAIHSADRLVRVPPRGGVLFEVLLAVALFAGAAALALGCVKSVFSALDRTRREQEAVDIARSRMAELEAGLINLADLRGQSVDTIGSYTMQGSDAAGAVNPARWAVDVKTQRTEFTGLSLVELTVREDVPPSMADDVDRMTFTLRQLMPLRRDDAEEYQPDEMMDGLPAKAGGAGVAQP
jgi:hypothetical protein